MVITGAGVSADSGIPTYRGHNGYWRNMNPMELATPEAFHANPSLVWEWYQERRQAMRQAQPNPAHLAITELSKKAKEFMLVTQNVDNLHERAGMNKDNMVHIHGEIYKSICTQCGKVTHSHKPATDTIISCTVCKGMLRPGVVWFNESLDGGEINRVEKFIRTGPCDTVIVIGTSAQFGYIIEWAVRAAGDRGKLIEINAEESGISKYAAKTIIKNAAEAVPELVRTLTG